MAEREIYRQKRNILMYVQGGSNMTGTDLCVNKSQFVPVIFEPPWNCPGVNCVRKIKARICTDITVCSNLRTDRILTFITKCCLLY
jgi:hypothetical protein